MWTTTINQRRYLCINEQPKKFQNLLPWSSGCVVKGMNCLHKQEHWDSGFNSHSRYGYLYCVRLFCVCVVLCVGSGLAMDWSLVHGVLRTVRILRNWKSSQGPKGCRATTREKEMCRESFRNDNFMRFAENWRAGQQSWITSNRTQVRE
jgi:hypothetical protein